MTTETLPLFLKYLHGFWEQLKMAIYHHLHTFLRETSPFPVEEVAPSIPAVSATYPEARSAQEGSKPNTQWVLAETTQGADEKSNVMMVEVEYFHDTYIADLQNACVHTMSNYTIDGEDPNLRITHYPPSNRVH